MWGVGTSMKVGMYRYVICVCVFSKGKGIYYYYVVASRLAGFF